jgi:transcriptional regulator of aromatic amino acid metabolism
MPNWLRRPVIRSALRYLLAVVSVVAALVAAQAFLHFHLPLAFMSFSFCAVAISFWYGGIGPGVLAAIAVVLIRNLVFTTEADMLSRISYALVFVLFSFFMTQATRARNELEMRVAKRTAALSNANEDLQLEIAERKRAEEALQENVAALKKAYEEIQLLKDQLYKENLALREEIDVNLMFEEIVGSSRALQTVLSRVTKVAPADSTVLITGETGTGKELIARAIHKRSKRSSRAFVGVNCAAIPRDLIASELFGHEKGAFTGATHRRLGRFESAHGGTLFLDEVGELPLETQVTLLAFCRNASSSASVETSQ